MYNSLSTPLSMTVLLLQMQANLISIKQFSSWSLMYSLHEGKWYVSIQNFLVIRIFYKSLPLVPNYTALMIPSELPAGGLYTIILYEAFSTYFFSLNQYCPSASTSGSLFSLISPPSQKANLLGSLMLIFGMILGILNQVPSFIIGIGNWF